MKTTLNQIAFLFLLLALTACGGSRKKTVETASEGEYLEVDGVRIFTRSMGKGEPILVVHGGPGLDHSYLLPQMEGLAKHHQLIFYDQRCSGKSQAGLDSSQVTLEAFLKDIEAIRKRHQIDRLNLLGHSWGGLLAMNYALAYPDHLKSVILSNGMGASSETRKEENAHLARKMTEEDAAEIERIRSSAAFGEGNSEAYEDFFRALFRIEFHDRALAEELTLDFPQDISARLTELGMLFQDLAYYDLHEDLSRVKQPVLLLYGSDEPLSYLVAPKLESAFPNARLEVLSDCGHFPFIERPDEFFGLIRNFIRDCDEE